jgi:CubicO group peptidase (beta-lactamase class C family)
LARIIEEVSGKPYETYVVDHILKPLAMNSTRFQIVEPDERYAKGVGYDDDELIWRIRNKKMNIKLIVASIRKN